MDIDGEEEIKLCPRLQSEIAQIKQTQKLVDMFPIKISSNPVRIADDISYISWIVRLFIHERWIPIFMVIPEDYPLRAIAFFYRNAQGRETNLHLSEHEHSPAHTILHMLTHIACDWGK